MSPHPLIMLYKETAEKEFPLLLFVGREPNDADPVGTELGNYDFDSKEVVDGKVRRRSRCTFWNMAYKLVGEFGPREIITGADLKQRCREAQSSVIAFADISPRSIRNPVGNKPETRIRLLDDEFQEHFKALQDSKLMKRFKLVLLTGSDNDGLADRRNDFAAMVNAQRKMAYSVPFLSTYSFDKVRMRVQSSPEMVVGIRATYDQWSQSPT